MNATSAQLRAILSKQSLEAVKLNNVHETAYVSDPVTLLLQQHAALDSPIICSSYRATFQGHWQVLRPGVLFTLQWSACVAINDFHRAKLQAPDANQTLVSRFPEFFRSLPLLGGGLGFAALLINRLLSKVAPFLDGGSSQSRVEILVIALAATLALTGFQWIALKPVQPKQVLFIACSTLA